MSTDPRVARTRDRVMDAAWQLLTEAGFDGVTVEDVSERSGVARSTLYRHWRSMPELLRDAFTAQARRRGPTDDAGTGLEALTAYAQAMAVGLVDLWGRAAVSLAASAAVHAEQGEVLQVFVEGNRRDLRALVEGAVAAGELAQGTDVGVVVEQLLDLVVAPLFYRYQFLDSPLTPPQAAELAARAWTAVRAGA